MSSTDPNKQGLNKGIMGAAAAVLVIGLIFNSKSEKRPETSAFSVSEWKNLCADSESFEKNCKGKFVIWKGTVFSQPDGSTVRVDVGDYRFDLFTNLKKIEAKKLFAEDYPDDAGAEITFSGYIDALNWTIPDIDKVHILQVHSTAEESLAKVSAKRQEVEKVKASEEDATVNANATKWGVSPSAFRIAEKHLSYAALLCQDRAADDQGLASDEWERRGWGRSNYNAWKMTDDNTVILRGNNMRTKNRGREEILNYTCKVKVDQSRNNVMISEVDVN